VEGVNKFANELACLDKLPDSKKKLLMDKLYVNEQTNEKESAHLNMD